jgi:membrane protease YdiL (CAAX protease family)
MEPENLEHAGPGDGLQWIFFNQRGLRPGWRILIFLVICLASFFFLIALIRPFASRMPQGMNPSVMMIGEILQFSVILFASWVMSRMERREMGEYGLPVRNSGLLPRFVRGYIFWGFLPLTLLLLVLRGLHSFYFGSEVLHGAEVLRWAVIWGVFFIFVGLFEEYSLRGYLLYTLAEGIGFWPAAVVLAALFAILHTFNKGEDRIGIIMTAVFAMFATVTLRYTGNLWIAVGAHAGWDWGETYFFGTSNSGNQLPGHLLNPSTQGPAWLNGGSAGPEGSILALVLLIAMSVLFALLYRKARQPVLVVTSG